MRVVHISDVPIQFTHGPIAKVMVLLCCESESSLEANAYKYILYYGLFLLERFEKCCCPLSSKSTPESISFENSRYLLVQRQVCHLFYAKYGHCHLYPRYTVDIFFVMSCMNQVTSRHLVWYAMEQQRIYLEI